MNAKRIGIVLFQNNLRLHDHPAWMAANDDCEEVIPLAIWDEQFSQKTSEGWSRRGKFFQQFVHDSLADLDLSLRKQRSRLFFSKQSTLNTIQEIQKRLRVNAIYISDELGSEEKSGLENIRSCFADLEIVICLGNQLYSELPMELEKLPRIFTDFRKKVEKNGTIDQVKVIQQIKPVPKELKDCYEWKHFLSAANLIFPAGEQAALERLNYYLWESHKALTYKQTRNELLGKDFSTKFSPYLAHGNLSVRFIMQELKRFEQEVNSNESTYWIFFELLWREFFRWQYRKFGNKFFQRNGLRDNPIEFQSDATKIQQWCSGNTGNDFIDANMIELNETGFMSNRGRQNVASYFIHDLNQDWRVGARYFESQLMDYDLCSNWGNWMYIAGVGNDPRPFRKFNITKQQEMYDPDTKFVRNWLS